MYIYEHIEEIAGAIQANTIKWDTYMLESLFETFPMGNDDLQQYVYLCSLLNNGTVICEVTTYKDADIPNRGDDSYSAYNICHRYQGSGELLWNGWNWLRQQGEEGIIFQNRGSVLYSQALSIFLKVGKGKPSRIVDSYLQNNHSYVHMPYDTRNNEMFIFKPSENFKNEMMEMERKKAEERRILIERFWD